VVLERSIYLDDLLPDLEETKETSTTVSNRHRIFETAAARPIGSTARTVGIRNSIASVLG
jgi:hypothetical protein